MNILVLGGNGFIGSHIVDKLIADGHSVRVFDRTPEHYRLPLPGVDYRLHSFNDIPALAESLEGIDVVFHLISTTVPSTSNLNPIADIEGNLITTINLLQLMAKMKIKRIVYLSSGGTIYGIPTSVPIDESHPLHPICSYGVIKLAIENYLHMFHHLHGIQYCSLRASNPYGTRQGHSGVQGVIGTFLSRITNDESLELWGDGSIVRDFIYVEDLANLCTKTCVSDVNGVFNVGSGIGHSIKEIISTIEEVSGKSARTLYRSPRPYDVPRVILDISKAKNTFDWEPITPLRDGIHRNFVWLNTLNA